MQIIRTIFIIPIKVYQLFVSPILPKRCIFEPSCSQYAIIAIKKYGIIYGLYLSIKRIIRCHPYSRGGIDEVP